MIAVQELNASSSAFKTPKRPTGSSFHKQRNKGVASRLGIASQSANDTKLCQLKTVAINGLAGDGSWRFFTPRLVRESVLVYLVPKIAPRQAKLPGRFSLHTSSRLQGAHDEVPFHP